MRWIIGIVVVVVIAILGYRYFGGPGGGDVAQQAEQGAQQAAEATQEAAEATGQAVEEAADQAAEATQEAAQQAQETAEQAAEATQEAAQQAQESAEQAAEATQETAQQVLGMPVRLGKPREVIDPKGLVDSPVYATAVGLLAFAAQRMTGRRRIKEPHSITAAAVRLFSEWLRRLRRK